MLVQRVITATGLLFLILGAIFGLTPRLFSYFIVLIIGISAWEWSSLAGIRRTVFRIAYVVLLLAVLLLIELNDNQPVLFLLMLGLLWWIAAFLLICLYPRCKGAWGANFSLFVIGYFLFLPGWQAMVYLRQQDFFAFHLLLLFAQVAAADIGAYFTGRAIGKSKLAPRVSPNKTWEGFVGGLLASCCLIGLVSLLFLTGRINLDAGTWLLLLGMAVCVSCLSVVGDLFESMVKRLRDVKDSGNILPGHGGMLDRVDGLTAAVPVYALLLMQFGQQLT